MMMPEIFSTLRIPRDREGILQVAEVVTEDIRAEAADRTEAKVPTAGVKVPCSAGPIRAMAVLEA